MRAASFIRKRRLRIETRTRFLYQRFAKGERPRVVVFLHIPKTAGSSVTRYMMACLGSRHSGHAARLKYQNDFEEQIEKVDFDRICFYSGHFGWQQANVIADEDRFLFTFLREPRERLLSWCLYLIGTTIKWQRIAGRDGPADLFENSDNSVCMLDNLMVRQLAGDMREVPSTERRWSALLEQAKDNLDRFDYIGFQENFDHDFARVTRMIGLPPVSEPPRINVTKELYGNISVDDIALDQDVMEWVEYLTRWDRKLYAYALAKFGYSRPRPVKHRARPRNDLAPAAATRQALHGAAHTPAPQADSRPLHRWSARCRSPRRDTPTAPPAGLSPQKTR